MRKKMTGLAFAAVAATLWSASAQAQDAKTTNGAACVPTIESTAVPSTASVVKSSGARFSTQEITGGNGQARRLLFVCPMVRDDLDNVFPVQVSIRVNTFNAFPPGHFTCRLKVVDTEGTTISQTVDVFMDEGFGSKVLSAPIVATHVDQAYVLNCRVPNVVGTSPRSGVISYKWSEESF